MSTALERIAIAIERGASALEQIAAVLEGSSSFLAVLSDIPEDYPGRDDLIERGIVLEQDIPRLGARLADLGLDDRLINQILSYQRSRV